MAEDTNNTRTASEEAKSTQKAESPKRNPIAQLEQIKDIIFGPEMEEMTANIADLQKDLVKQREDLEKRISALNAEMVESLVKLNDNLSDSMEKMSSEINNNIDQLKKDKTDRKELGKLLIQLGEQIMKED